MKMMKILYFFVGACFVVNFGCAALKIERNVQDNVFYSSKLPKIRIKINRDFEYIGKYERTRTDTKCPTIITSYTFCQVGENDLLKKAVLIVFTESRGCFWFVDLFSRVKNKLDSGSVTISGKRYQYAVTTSTNFYGKDVNEYILDKGYIISNCYLVKCLGRIVSADADTKMCVYYFEDIFYNEEIKYGCFEWKDATLLSDEQSTFLKEFLDRSERDIQILGE